MGMNVVESIVGIDPGKTHGLTTMIFGHPYDSSGNISRFPRKSYFPTVLGEQTGVIGNVLNSVNRIISDYHSRGVKGFNNIPLIVFIEGVNPFGNRLNRDIIRTASAYGVYTYAMYQWEIPFVVLEPGDIRRELAPGISRREMPSQKEIIEHLFDPCGVYGSHAFGNKKEKGPLYNLKGIDKWDVSFGVPVPAKKNHKLQALLLLCAGIEFSRNIKMDVFIEKQKSLCWFYTQDNYDYLNKTYSEMVALGNTVKDIEDSFGKPIYECFKA